MIFVNVCASENTRKILNEMIGVIRLPVSKYSAIKKGGEALYKKAYRGEDVVEPLRDMEIILAKLNKIEQEKDQELYNKIYMPVFKKFKLSKLKKKVS